MSHLKAGCVLALFALRVWADGSGSDEAACKKGNAAACAKTGSEQIKAKDYAKARALIEQGCKLGSAEACDNLGWIYDDGLGIVADKKQAEAHYGKACWG